MNENVRRAYFAWGLAIILFLLLAGALLHFQYTDMQLNSEYAEKCVGQNQALASSSLSRSALIPIPHNGNSSGLDASAPDWCGLAAQQSMAVSSRGMNWAAWVTVLFTVVGAILVWRTLVATQATVSVTRDIGQAQTRAYLGIDSICVCPGNSRVQFHLKNFGQSMAKKVNVETSCHVDNGGFRGKISSTNGGEEREKIEHLFGIINAGHSPLGIIDFEELRDPEGLRVKLVIDYDDIFEGKWRQCSEYHLTSEGKDIGNLVMRVVPGTADEVKRN